MERRIIESVSMRETRRGFLQKSGALAGVGWAAGAQTAKARVAVVHEMTEPAVLWAVSELRRVSGGDVRNPELYVLVERGPLPSEAFHLARARHQGKPAMQVTAGDTRGFVYGLLEMADRIRWGGDVMAAAEETPANRVRSIARAFVSEVEDKPWFYDKDFWREYLTTLASERFNRFALTLGLGYDFPRGVTGDYLHFAYPYLVQVPGYDVRAVPLEDGEPERNLAALQFISEETAARGLDFQLGIWTHAYAWTDSPKAQHRIEGLTAETHGQYCRDAMMMLLKSCPAISGVTMRVHGESGIPEGSYSFWQDVFDGIARGGRRIRIDLHAKGLDEKQLAMAYGTGMPVSISPKYWAEHMGLGYQQAAIRELEMPRPERKVTGTFAVSEGSRRFLRYGYGDLFQEGRRYDVLFRMWPGTERLLLWGDPATAAAYGRTSTFQGAVGVEICEPLFFKGRQGSGLAGGRCAYGDQSLEPKWDFEKYLYAYRVWGRLLYNPQADPETWHRYLRAEFGSAAPAAEAAMAHGSRILPLFTTTRLPSASNQACWPEMYTNMPIVEGGAPVPYLDTVVPRRLGTVSPLDPQLFSSIIEYAGELLNGKQSGKYSPVEVATWLEEMADTAEKFLTAAGEAANDKTAVYRRMDEDVRIQIGLGQFFARQIRSAVLFELFLQTGDPAAHERAIATYRAARGAWGKMARRAQGVYRADVTFGDTPQRRGHWADRLGAIDVDLEAMQSYTRSAAQTAPEAIRAALASPVRPSVHYKHKAPKMFAPDEAIVFSLAIPEGCSAMLFYRHVDQAERWQTTKLDTKGEARIPTEYTRTAFALQYYFEVRDRPDNAWVYPGFGAALGNQPYFVISRG